MNQHTRLTHLEHDLLRDLAETRRLLRSGRDQAIEVLNGCGEEIGDLLPSASHEIEQFAHKAEEDLKLVGKRLGELHLLISRDELENLDVFDHFCDRVVQAMEFAERDIEDLKYRGDEWCVKRSAISKAWSELSRRLALVRMHLVQEGERVAREFRADRCDMVAPEEALPDEE